MRSFSLAEKQLLRSDHQVRLLCIFYLDEGTYAFCDDVVNCTDGSITYIGANSLVSSLDISSGNDLAAEPVTMTCDGNRMAQFGIQDPAKVLSDIMGYLAQQRRVDWFLGFSPIDSETITFRIPIYAGKINSYVLTDPRVDFDSKDETVPSLVITLDALASRYSRITNRTRSHEDQQEIDLGDKFFSFTVDAIDNEAILYWGKDSPYGNGAAAFGSGGSSGYYYNSNYTQNR